MDKVKLESTNGPIEIGVEYGSGGTSVTYECPALPDKLIKIWNNTTVEKQKKVKVMCDSPPTSDDSFVKIATPLERAFSVSSGECIGFTMQRAMGVPLDELVNPTLRPLAYQNYASRLRLAGNLAKAVQNLNGNGYILLDGLSPQNVIVGNSEICLIDVDSWQLTSNGTVYPADSAFLETCPPELIGQNSSTSILNDSQDAWVLAVVIFWILASHHPFEAKFNSLPDISLERRIAEGIWPYSRHARQQGVFPHPSNPLKRLHPSMQRLAKRCFGTGAFRQDARPKAAEWHRAIQKALDDKTFLSNITKIEANSPWKRAASIQAAMMTPSQTNKKRHFSWCSQKLQKRKIPLAVALMCVVVMVATLFCHNGTPYDESPTLVQPTGVVYEGIPKPMPEFWGRSAVPSSSEFSYCRSRRPCEVGSRKPTPKTWKYLQTRPTQKEQCYVLHEKK